MKRRSGEAQAAQHRKAGPMKHRLEPRGGSRKDEFDYETDDECPDGYMGMHNDLRQDLTISPVCLICGARMPRG